MPMEATNKLAYYKLFSFADSIDYIIMLVGTISAVGNGLCLPLTALIFGELVDSFGENADTQELVHQVSKASIKYVYLALGAGVASFSQLVCWTITGERQAARIRNLYLKALLRQDIGFFDTDIKTGDIIKNISCGTVTIQDAIGEQVGKFIQLVWTFLGGLIIAFVKGWQLALVLLSSIPLLVISSAVSNILKAKLISHGQTAYSQAATVVGQTVGSIRTVASFTGERQAITTYDKSLNRAYQSGVQEGLAVGLSSGVFMFVLLCSYALAVWYGAKMILHKEYTGGEVVSVLIALMAGAFSFGQASPCLSAFMSGRVAAFMLFQTINREPEIDPYNTSGKKLDDIHGDIELKDVVFSYPARPDEPIFDGFSLSIPSGTTTALVGQSGSGKSTVINLIERFYDPQAGKILIDGINLKEFQLRWIRDKIGLVSQEPVLFSSSIKDNIAYGNDGATIEEIKAAAEIANAAKFIDKLPQGLDTMVGEHGTQLSGGQKQRIAIARAILRDPRILLLDEATSALDAESERIVQEALERVMINRTTVIVAHRLSTIKNADEIAVIHQGKIVEKGSHIELLQDLEGAYSQLIRMKELNKESELCAANDENRSVMTVDSRSIDRHSLRGSFGGVESKSKSQSISNVGETEVVESKSLVSEPSKMDLEVPLFRLAYLTKPEIPVLILGSIAAAVCGLALPLFGLLLASMIKTFYKPTQNLRKDSEFWASMFVVLGVLFLVATPLKNYFFSVAGCKLIKRIRLMCFEKVVHMEISWFDKTENSSGAIGARLSAHATSMRSLTGDTLSLLVQNTATAIAGLIIGFQASWRLSLIILVLVPLYGLKGYVQMKFLNGLSKGTEKLYEDASQVASDAVGSIRTVASFCAEEMIIQLYKRKCEGPVRVAIKQGLICGIAFGLSMFVFYSIYGASYYAGARLVAAGKTTIPEVFRVFMALSMMAIAISQSGAFASDSIKIKRAAVSVLSLLDQKSKIDSSNDSGGTLESVQGDIEFCNVSFRYPTRPDVQIFNNLCLAIRSGKTIALVGESGSGKSTVISLLQRFYDPNSGYITLDGVKIQKLKLKWLRQQMGLVSQEPVLFNDTIRANIAYGKEGNSTEAEILAVAKIANIHNFISGLQQGYDTIVGERGIQLSGGQKQRVAIARAIVKAPKILLLDEATSALDDKSEKVVQDALDRVMMERTTVVVAHRLSTIKDVDLIVVVKNGVIVEKGKHDNLINIKDGIYASLVALNNSGVTL